MNPAAGQERAILAPINRVLRQSGVQWDTRVTRGRGDALRLAREAAQDGVDRVVVYGGDGTMMEMAGGLAGTQVPLGIVPGGSANILAEELGIPKDIASACRLALREDARMRSIDVGRAIGPGEIFVVRIGTGFDARMIREASGGQPRTGGMLAYWKAAVQAMRRTPVARYRLWLDGREIETRGVLCTVTNPGNAGDRKRRLAPGIDVSDGHLDVVVWRSRSLPALLAIARDVLSGHYRSPAMQHWAAREVRIESDPPQLIEIDGEPCGQTPVQAEVWPGALRVIVPS